jgi:hypothetical protein
MSNSDLTLQRLFFKDTIENDSSEIYSLDELLMDNDEYEKYVKINKYYNVINSTITVNDPFIGQSLVTQNWTSSSSLIYNTSNTTNNITMPIYNLNTSGSGFGYNYEKQHDVVYGFEDHKDLDDLDLLLLDKAIDNNVVDLYEFEEDSIDDFIISLVDSSDDILEDAEFTIPNHLFDDEIGDDSDRFLRRSSIEF